MSEKGYDSTALINELADRYHIDLDNIKLKSKYLSKDERWEIFKSYYNGEGCLTRFENLKESVIFAPLKKINMIFEDKSSAEKFNKNSAKGLVEYTTDYVVNKLNYPMDEYDTSIIFESKHDPDPKLRAENVVGLTLV